MTQILGPTLDKVVELIKEHTGKEDQRLALVQASGLIAYRVMSVMLVLGVTKQELRELVNSYLNELSPPLDKDLN